MRVTLNGAPLEFTLEKERTIGEFLAGIEGWLEGKRFSVSGLMVDGQEIPAEKIEEISAFGIDEVDSLDLRASSWSDLYIQALRECGRFLEAAAAVRGSARSAGIPTLLEDIAAEFEESAAGGILAGKEPELRWSIAAAIRGAGTDPDADIAAARKDIGERISEIEQPRVELKQLGADTVPLAERLEMLPLELQTGKDAQAAATLRDFTTFAAKLLRLIPAMQSVGIDPADHRIGDQSFEEFFEEFNTALRELTAGYESGDSILVGDLAEYELAPRLRTLDHALAALADQS